MKTTAEQTKNTIFFIAPSTPVDEGTIKYAEQVFGEMGFKTAHTPDMTKRHFNWGNSAEHRAQQIIQALYDSKVKAIYALEGGEGASEVVAELKKPENLERLLKAPNRGIPLIGGSDITFLHHFLGEHGIVTPVQGPTFSYLTSNRDYVVFENGELKHTESVSDETTIVSRPRKVEHARAHQQNADAIKQFLATDDVPTQCYTIQPFNAKAKEARTLEGYLVGGYDQVTQMARYVTYDTQTPIHAAVEKPILFLESKTTKDLEATLALMKESGDLSRYQGIVLGKYTGNPDQTNPDFPAHQVAAVLERVGIQDSIPVFHGVAFGHGPRGAELRPIPLYTSTSIAIDGDKAMMSVAGSSTQEDLDRRSAFKPAPVQDKKTALTPPVAVNNIRLDQPFVSTINELYSQNMAGKDVVLHFPFDADTLKNAGATTNPVHVILMPLVTSGKLQQAKSLTLSADGEYTTEFKSWLKEFSEKNLPNVKLATAEKQKTIGSAIQHDAEYFDLGGLIAPPSNTMARHPCPLWSPPSRHR